MDKSSAISLLEKTFKNSFDMDNYVRFLKELFNKSNIRPRVYNAIRKEFWSYENEVYILGDYEDDNGDSMALYAIELSKQSSRDRARTMQRNLVASLIKDKYDSALVAFYEPNLEDWRFSHVKIEYEFNENGINEKLSSPRRHSFLVGVNEPNHTCQSQFLDLIANEDNIQLKDIEYAFSIENVTDEFFNKYNDLFLQLTESLDKVKENDIEVKFEFNEKNIKSSDFAKKLMGQIVFIYFLQKKGWLGVEKNNKWGSGPKNFFNMIFKKCITEGKNFFNDVLEPLFYEGLSEEVSDDHYSTFSYKVPFLNGGLFEPINDYNWTDTDVLLDNSIFENIINTFNKFNFTVKEDEPLEKEVAVDPEMLGKVFENLLEIVDRKSKGAFYTPRYIVHYMCQESLISYLNTNSDIPEEDLRTFITKGELAIDSIIRANEEKKKYNGNQYTNIELPNSIRENTGVLENLLQKVKVIDPAVGSGAFPVGMMNEIVKARYILYLLAEIDDINLYDLKRETIENSLYGVDVELSATDVTKLRFWLSLIVDEENIEEIRPLPNLDNQIMCGNSLVDSFEGIKLFDNDLIKRGAQQKLMITPIERTFNDLENKKNEYFKTSGPKNKSRLKTEINKLKWDFIIKQIENSDNPKLINNIINYKDSQPRPFFVWELEFSEIFKGNNPGFDIVIGNPPYHGEKDYAHVFDPIKNTELGNKFYQGKMDLYYFFFHKGLDICKENGCLSFITTNYFISNKGATKLRKDFKKRASFLNLIDFNELKIFESALGQHNLISIMIKGHFDFNSNNMITRNKGVANQETLNIILSQNDKNTDYYSIPNSNLFDGKDNVIRLAGTGIFNSGNEEIDKRNKLLNKLEKNVDFYLDSKDITQGVVPNPDKINGRHINKFPDEIKNNNILKGDFVFTVPKKFFNNLNDYELTLLKQLYEPNEFKKYYLPRESILDLLYITKKNCNNPNQIPNFINHLKKFKFIMDERRENKKGSREYYHLHWPRDEHFFEKGDKIFSARKCNEPTFVHVKDESYCMLSCNVIKTDKINMKALTVILNSKLVKFWLKYKGKLKGSNFQIDADQIYEIPLIKLDENHENELIDIEEKLVKSQTEYIEIYNENNDELLIKIEDIIEKADKIIYEIYNLNDDEINIINKQI